MKKWQKMKHVRRAEKIALFSIECAEIYLKRKHVEPSFPRRKKTNGGLFYEDEYKKYEY